jgi:hypothetical protein
MRAKTSVIAILYRITPTDYDLGAQYKGFHFFFFVFGQRIVRSNLLLVTLQHVMSILLCYHIFSSENLQSFFVKHKLLN